MQNANPCEEIIRRVLHSHHQNKLLIVEGVGEEDTPRSENLLLLPGPAHV